MRDNLFRASVLIFLAVIAVGVFLHSENGHYQFIKSESHSVILDTRTGEFWVDGMEHIDSRRHLVETIQPTVTEAKRP
jgi:hypothetical protein